MFLTTSQAPHSGQFVVSPTANIKTLETEVTFSAPSWKDQKSDTPIQLQFGFYFVYNDGSLSEFMILRPFDFETTFSTQLLPAGTLRLALQVRDRHGTTRTVKLGCQGYQTDCTGSVDPTCVHGQWATDQDCPDVSTITVSNVVLPPTPPGQVAATHASILEGVCLKMRHLY